MFGWLGKKRKNDQKIYDKALIAMPTCLVSSAYVNNPFYHDYKSLVEWGKSQLLAYKKKVACDEFGENILITNNVSCGQVEEWLNYCSALAGKK